MKHIGNNSNNNKIYWYIFFLYILSTEKKATCHKAEKNPHAKAENQTGERISADERRKNLIRMSNGADRSLPDTRQPENSTEYRTRQRSQHKRARQY